VWAYVLPPCNHSGGDATNPMRRLAKSRRGLRSNGTMPHSPARTGVSPPKGTGSGGIATTEPKAWVGVNREAGTYERSAAPQPAGAPWRLDRPVRYTVILASLHTTLTSTLVKNSRMCQGSYSGEDDHPIPRLIVRHRTIRG